MTALRAGPVKRHEEESQTCGVSPLGAHGALPLPDPDGAVVQKAQYICALWQNILSYFI